MPLVGAERFASLVAIARRDDTEINSCDLHRVSESIHRN